jgi:hypothetical protein
VGLMSRSPPSRDLARGALTDRDIQIPTSVT